MKIYNYKTRTIIEFDDGTRASYSKKSKYGDLQNMVVEQAIKLNQRLGNPYKINKDGSVTMYHFITTTGETIESLLDYDDWVRLRHCYWGIDSGGYISTSTKEFSELVKGVKIRLHNVIMKHYSFDTEIVDHINNNRKDNRKSNLRIIPKGENIRNLSIKDDKGIPRGITKRKNFYEVRAKTRNGVNIRKTFKFHEYEEAVKYNEKIRKENGYLK